MMTKNDSDKIKDSMIDTVFLNLYPYGLKPYWTTHTSRQVAENDAKLHRVVDSDVALHIAIPVHKDWFE